jgi:hypothetical protein
MLLAAPEAVGPFMLKTLRICKFAIKIHPSTPYLFILASQADFFQRRFRYMRLYHVKLKLSQCLAYSSTNFFFWVDQLLLQTRFQIDYN